MTVTKKSETLRVADRNFRASVRYGHDFPVLSARQARDLCRHLGLHDLSEEFFPAEVNGKHMLCCLDTRPHDGCYHYWCRPNA